VSARQVTLLAALAAVWGSSYLLIKYALDGFSPAEVVCIRTGVAAAVLWAVLRGQGEPAAKTWNDVKTRPWLALGFGAVGIAAPFLLISYGELEVPSGLTAILIAPAPLLVALLAPLIDHDERIQGSQGIGLVVGIVGVALVVGIEFVDSWIELIAAIGIIGAALCYAIAGFIVKGNYKGLPAIGTSAISCSIAAVLTLPVALATAKGHHADAGAIAAAICLGIVQTALALAILYHLIGEIGAGRANLVNYLIPGVALAYGAIFRDEEITAAAIVGLALILVGVGLASRKSRDPASDAPPEALTMEEACPPDRGISPEAPARRA
jgi:drug/metabolite transporter (DMT)-like permease